MINVLYSDSASNEIPLEDRIYDWLIGEWNVIVKDYEDDGTIIESIGEWHFFRALEGRAVQDVWICPSRTQRYDGMPKKGNRYGTSIRFFHPTNRIWNVVWINPVSGIVNNLVARKIDNDIIQTGLDEDGNVFRWIFSEIQDESCRWYGERSYNNEKSWCLEAEFLMTRKK